MGAWQASAGTLRPPFSTRALTQRYSCEFLPHDGSSYAPQSGLWAAAQGTCDAATARNMFCVRRMLHAVLWLDLPQWATLAANLAITSMLWRGAVGRRRNMLVSLHRLTPVAAAAAQLLWWRVLALLGATPPGVAAVHAAYALLVQRWLPLTTVASALGLGYGLPPAWHLGVSLAVHALAVALDVMLDAWYPSHAAAAAAQAQHWPGVKPWYAAGLVSAAASALLAALLCWWLAPRRAAQAAGSTAAATQRKAALGGAASSSGGRQDRAKAGGSSGSDKGAAAANAGAGGSSSAGDGGSIGVQALVKVTAIAKDAGAAAVAGTGHHGALYGSPTVAWTFGFKVTEQEGGVQRGSGSGGGQGVQLLAAAAGGVGGGGSGRAGGGGAYQAQVARVRGVLEAMVADIAAGHGLQVLRTSTTCFPGCVHALLTLVLPAESVERQDSSSCSYEQLQHALLAALQAHLRAHDDCVALTPVMAGGGASAAQQQPGQQQCSGAGATGAADRLEMWDWCELPHVSPVALPAQQQPGMEPRPQQLQLVLPAALRRRLAAAAQHAGSGNAGALRVVVLPDGSDGGNCVQASWQLSGWAALPAEVSLDLPPELLSAPVLAVAVVFTPPHCASTQPPRERMLVQHLVPVVPAAATAELRQLFARMAAAVGEPALAAVAHYSPLVRDMPACWAGNDAGAHPEGTSVVAAAAAAYLMDCGLAATLAHVSSAAGASGLALPALTPGQQPLRGAAPAPDTGALHTQQGKWAGECSAEQGKPAPVAAASAGRFSLPPRALPHQLPLQLQAAHLLRGFPDPVVEADYLSFKANRLLHWDCTAALIKVGAARVGGLCAARQGECGWRLFAPAGAPPWCVVWGLHGSSAARPAILLTPCPRPPAAPLLALPCR